MLLLFSIQSDPLPYHYSPPGPIGPDMVTYKIVSEYYIPIAIE